VWDPEAARLFLGDARRTSPHYALYLFSLCTAARPGEALALRWEDVNLPLGTVDIKRKVYRFTEKERQACGLEGRLLVNGPKTKNGIRTIPLVGILVEELRRLREEQRRRQELLDERYQDNGLVFCGVSGKFLHFDVIRRDFNEIVTRLKLPPIRYYDLRHSAASFLVALGVDVQTVSKIMGHSSAAFTLKQYVHDVSGTKAEAMKRLEASLFGNKTEGQ
jgi:integrase